LLSGFEGPGVEKDLPRFLFAKHSSQFTESDEGDKHNKHERCQSKNSFPGTSAEIGDTLVST
jgi:hypothetical protein